MILKHKNSKPIVFFLMGPTACGKTQTAISLRNYLPIEIISVDSALIYRYMNIGTAKPSSVDLLHHPHRLLNIKDPSEHYSAAEFYHDALKEIHHIIKLGKIPFLVGGTMFYYHVLLNGLPNLPASSINIREFLLHHRKEILHKKLESIDPVSAKRIHKNDVQRLLRALEIFYLSGKNLTELKKNNHRKLPYNILQFSIMPPNKELLNRRIELRIKNMFQIGFQKEVESLFLRGDLHINLPAIRCIGYRQMWEYLEYKISYEDMFNKIIYSTKKLAKHQMTWLKKWKNLNKLLYSTNTQDIVEQFLNRIKIIN
ncbi:tRNA (adenosine(37)-N6)-dimethylallyltransferase MiaA [Buchnera aphidicola (Hyadaphis tataricae)]|uniref:tRNA dimethylallyltransferase n=2 Tax=Buchnera aphidicola TaxID=9 RepID=A0A4D6XZZ5_9GAMM|nr:tRNA (adenosine(37)-N6)-dimethylallyltransferase MiaA [Buchnera aphidicola (Hyadaphis tataricae)]